MIPPQAPIDAPLVDSYVDLRVQREAESKVMFQLRRYFEGGSHKSLEMTTVDQFRFAGKLGNRPDLCRAWSRALNKEYYREDACFREKDSIIIALDEVLVSAGVEIDDFCLAFYSEACVVPMYVGVMFTPSGNIFLLGRQVQEKTGRVCEDSLLVTSPWFLNPHYADDSVVLDGPGDGVPFSMS